MVWTKSELISAVQADVHILLHLANKIYRSQLFLHLKACRRHELTSDNLWCDVDLPRPTA